VKKIPLTLGAIAFVDDEDFDYLNQFNWSIHYAFKYAKRTIGGRLNKNNIFMHRLLMNAKEGEFVDHIDRNTLNNQKSNLRICNWSENNINKSKRIGTSSKFVGVYLNKKVNKWQAYIKKNKKFFYLGIFENEIDAAIARDKKAKELHGEFANINIII
jgi:hypothetical protein